MSTRNLEKLHRAFLVALAAAALASGCRTNGNKEPIDPARSDGGGPVDGPVVTTDSGSNSTPLDPCVLAPMGSKPPAATCSCDKECASGYCENGACCAGASCAARPLGAPCQEASQCESGFCTDGVCCNLACTGACVSCAHPDRPGECVPVPAGLPDTHGICRTDPAESCGQSGACNGLGGCAKFAPATLCEAARCEGQSVLYPSGQCDGDGACIAGAALDCAPYTCNEGLCRTACQTDNDCVPPNVCTNGSCGPRGNGQACTADVQCASGFCVDGVCCENACEGKCTFCARPDSRGRCVPVPANTPDPRAAAGVTDSARVCLDQGAASCGDNGRCDGRGGCARYPNGEPCRARSCSGSNNQETGEGVCRNGSCQVPNPRTCAPYQGCSGTACRTRCTSNSQCSSGNECLDGSCGKRPIGALCDRNSQCEAPGICAQGRCCASACTASCMSCNVAGSVGTCAPVRAGGADPTGACGQNPCTSGCDGAGSCRNEPNGMACGQSTCAPANQVREHSCVDGMCRTMDRACPPNAACSGGTCVDSRKPLGGECARNGECLSGACVAGRCCAGACPGECQECTAGTNWRCQAKPNRTPCGDPGIGQICRQGMCLCPAGTIRCPPGSDGPCVRIVQCGTDPQPDPPGPGGPPQPP